MAGWVTRTRTSRTSRTTRLAGATPAGSALALGAAACGSDSEKDEAAKQTASPSSAADGGLRLPDLHGEKLEVAAVDGAGAAELPAGAGRVRQAHRCEHDVRAHRRQPVGLPRQLTSPSRLTVTNYRHLLDNNAITDSLWNTADAGLRGTPGGTTGVPRTAARRAAGSGVTDSRTVRSYIRVDTTIARLLRLRFRHPCPPARTLDVPCRASA